MKRIFIAVSDHESSANLECELMRIRGELNGEKIKWVNDSLHHLTLCFLGSIEDNRFKMIGDSLENIVKNYNPFVIKLGGLGVFPNVQRPRIIWIGVEGKELIKLGEEVNREMKRLGFKIEDRKFSPHLTVGRVKFVSKDLPQKLKKIIQSPHVHSRGVSCRIEKIEIMESILNSEGPIYKVVTSMNL